MITGRFSRCIISLLLVFTWAPHAAADPKICLIYPSEPFYEDIRKAATTYFQNAANDSIEFATIPVETGIGNYLFAISYCYAGDAVIISSSNTEILTVAANAARDQGLFVVTLGAPLTASSWSNFNVATSDFSAGALLGKWVAKKTGSDSKILLLNSYTSAGLSSQSNQGFLYGLEVDLEDPYAIGDERDERIVGNLEVSHDPQNMFRSAGQLDTFGRTSYVAFAVNENVAARAYPEIQKLGNSDTLIVSAGATCVGVDSVVQGQFDAVTISDVPTLAQLAVEAALKLISGETPAFTGNDDPCGDEDEVPADACCLDPDSCHPGLVRVPPSLVDSDSFDRFNSILPYGSAASCRK